MGQVVVAVRLESEGEDACQCDLVYPDIQLIRPAHKSDDYDGCY